MTCVVDASLVVAGLLAKGVGSDWAEARIVSGVAVAPHLLPAEVASTLRRLVAREKISQDVAALAIDELADLPITYYAAEPLLARIWALRENVTAYDAWYVALAESLDVPLATLDSRLAAAPGPRCRFIAPPD